MKDTFIDKAPDWDNSSKRSNGAKTILKAIEKIFPLHKEMQIMDFGVGTGLLGFEVAKKVHKVTGVDTSKSMLQKLEEKNTPLLHIDSLHLDIISNPISEKFHGIVSSMTLHHIQDLESFFETIYKNLLNNGFIAIADLELEDGTFHSDNKDVFHFGFSKDILINIVKKVGFTNVRFENINTIHKNNKEFGVFLLSACR